jgi:hypothetical protein
MPSESKERYPLFSNATEFMTWQSRNCERCVKAVWYNEKTDTFPKHRCKVQFEIEFAAVGDGCSGSKRASEATHQAQCPYIQTVRKPRTKRKAENELTLFTNL